MNTWEVEMVKDSDSGTLEKWTLGLWEIGMVKDSDSGALGKWTIYIL